jgi:2-hydroxychromene-2-carboxylate isomerase
VVMPVKRAAACESWPVTRARFYYDLSSPFAYLAAHRVDDLLPVEVEWVPIAFGPLLVKIGRVPWSLQADREIGMRECERRAAEYGLPPIRWPEGWPAESYSVDGPRAALAAKHVGRERELSKALFRQVFVEGKRMDDRATIEVAAAEVGIDAIGECIAAVKEELREVTDDAIARGVTGIPTVELPDGTLVWGDDRLPEAAAAA